MKNMYLNLTQMLQGCSKRNGMTVRASNPDGEPTVNRQSRLMSLSGKKAEKEQLSPSCLLSASFPLSFRSRYLRYAAVIFCVLAMSVGQAWGDTELFSTDFKNDWTNATLVTDGDITTTTPTYPAEMYFRASGSGKTVTITDKGVTQCGNLSVNNYISGVKLTGINGSITITLTHTYSDKKPTFRYYFVDGATAFSSSVSASYSTSTAPSSNGEPAVITISGIKNTSGVFYFGAASSSYYSIASITVTTPSGGCAATANAGADKETTVGVGVAMAATAASSGYTGAWSIKDSSPSTATSQLGTTSSNTMTFTPNTYGTYTLVWTVTDNEDGSCSATDEATVTVPAPTHSITYTNLKGADNSANPTTYTEGVGVASFANLRHLVGYDFTGWSPSSISSSATTNQTIDAQWTARAAAAGTGTLTYALAFESSTITTSSITRNNGALYDATNISTANTSFVSGDEAPGNGCSGKLATTSSKSGSNYVELTFKIADGYTFTPSGVSIKANAVSNNKTLEVELKDNAASPHTKSVTAELEAGSTSGGVTYNLDFSSSPVTLEGTVTLKIYVYGSSGATKGWRIGPSVIVNGTVASTAPSCTAPASVSVDATNTNGWRYTIGETIDLTCTAEGGTGTKTYQWQKYIGSSWEDIDGATNARFQKTSCTSSDGGSYRCVVSTGAGCELASSGYQVYVFTLNGNYYGSVWTENAITWTGANTGTVTLNLTESSTYMYKVTNNDSKWYGGTSGNFLVLPAARDHYTDQSADIRLFTGPAGNYTFTIDITHFNDFPGTPYVNISVAYPTVSHPAAGYAYFKKWNDWSGYYIHWWYNDGSDHPLSTWGSDPQVTTETTICGTDYIYFPVLDTYNKLIVKDAAGDASHTTGDLSSVGSSGKYFDFTNNNAWNTFTTYTVTTSISPAGYGTVSAASVTGVACGTSISASTNTLSVGATNVTATPAAATAEYTYAFDNWTWTPAGATVTSDVTATANFTRTPKSYTLTWVTDGDALTGAYTSGSVAYGTTITKPDTPTKTGYTFAGWSSTPASTMPAANTTYTATWTAKQTTITINANTANHGSTAPSSITATYGSELPSFTAATGASGYSLTGYFTAATDGTKVINADGSLVAGTDYADGSGNWKYETATLTLYPQYEEEVVSPSKCITFNSTSAPSVSGVTIKKVAGGEGGSTYTASGFVMSQKNDYITFDISALGNLTKATFTAKTNSDSKKIGYGYTDGTSYVGEVPSEGTADTDFHEYEITSIPDNTTRFTLVRRGTGTTITEVCLFYTPISCSTPAAPTGFTAGSITSTGATFTITDAGDAASYDIYYSTSNTAPNESTPATTTSTSKTKAVTGLTASTTYYAWVRSVCDDTHKSSWFAGSSFTTSAAAGTTYYLVTSTEQLNTTDTYVIMDDGKNAMMGVYGENAMTAITSGFTAADDKSTVTVTNSDVNTLTLQAESSAWNIVGKDDNKLTTNSTVGEKLFGNTTKTKADDKDDFVFSFADGKATIKRTTEANYHIYYTSGTGFNQSTTATNIRLYTSNSTPVDVTAPTLYSSTPADDATGVGVSGNIVLTFSENVTINDASKFSLTGGAGTLNTASASASGADVTIPYTGLAYNTTYTLATAAEAVKDGSNNKNAALSDITFTTLSATGSCNELNYVWQTGSSKTPKGVSKTYAEGDVAMIDNDDVATTHITISGTNYEQKSGSKGSLNTDKATDNYFLLTAASGYMIDSVYFYGKLEDGTCRMSKDGSAWTGTLGTGATGEKVYAIGVGTQNFGLKNKDIASPKGVWIRTMMVKVCPEGTTYTVSYDANGHGSAPDAETDIDPGSTISAPSAPTTDCWTFNGWYKDRACTNVWNFAEDEVNSNITLYAKWTSNKARVKGLDYGETDYTVNPAGTGDAITVTPVSTSGVTYKWYSNTSDDVSTWSEIPSAETASYSPSIAVAGTKYYWAVLVHDCGNDTTSSVRINVAASKTEPTIVWGNVKLGSVDATPTYGGGGYTLTGTINGGDDATPTLDASMISADGGIVITDKSVNDASKTFSLTFDMTAAFDTTQAKITNIHFSLPSNSTYNDSVFSTNLSFDKCSGGSYSTDVYVVGYTNATGTSTSSSANKALKVAKSWISTASPSFTDKTSADGFSISATRASYYWKQSNQTIISSTTGATMIMYKVGKNSCTIEWTTSSLSFSKVRIIGRNESADPSTVTVSNGTEEKTFTFAGGKQGELQIQEVSMEFVHGSKKGVRLKGDGAKEISAIIELVPTGSDGAGTGTATTLQWKSGKAPSDISGWDGSAKKIVKAQSDDDFTCVAEQTSATNSVGAITYASDNTDVATVNETTGEVDIVAGAAGGEATITATMARSGCFMRSTISYTISVAELACAIEPGTLTASATSKCTAANVTLTLSDYTSGTTISWYKSGTAEPLTNDATYTIDGATLTTAQEGTYYAKVTLDGCSLTSNNVTITNKSGAASVSKLVNQWYIKKGRVTPDIALWRLGEGSSYVANSVKADGVALTDQLGGCTVIARDSTIYLSGGDPTGISAVGDVSLTVQVQDECGNTTTSDAITIHKQVATDKHELAFVTTGTNYAKKEFTEDAWTAGIKAANSTGLALYQVLKDTFKIQATNIYASDDEKKLREYYSQYDLICITDYPNTGTKGKNSKSYVDAMGSLIDIRPVLTMEAWVSGLDNWRNKGVVGTRTTPSKRQYNMYLQCKDHEIFEGVKMQQIGYGDDALFKVNMVDSTQSRYAQLDAVGKDRHATDTAALQGFTTGDMDLLALGLIDNGSGTNLQVGAERQTVMAARMMVLGINSYAMERLSDDGMRIIVNALQYLTKKRADDISDCSTYFTNAAGDSRWENSGNWRSGTLPVSNQEVRILKPVVISDSRKIASLKIVVDGTFHGIEANGSLTIAPTGTLIVESKIQSAIGPDVLSGYPTETSHITIQTDNLHQGALIFDNSKGDTRATVDLYSKGCNDGSYKFQYFASPFMDISSWAFGDAYIYTHDESLNPEWTQLHYGEDVSAFQGLSLTADGSATNYTIAGTLASTNPHTFNLTYTSGKANNKKGTNIIGNSWSAPIQITRIDDSDFNNPGNFEGIIYIYNAGRDKLVEGNVYASNGNAEPGQWQSIPVDLAKTEEWEHKRQIPAFQAFQMKVNAPTEFTLDYNKHVRQEASVGVNNYNEPLHAPRRSMRSEAVKVLRLCVEDEQVGKSYIYLCEGDQFTEERDRGWEAQQTIGSGKYGKLYAIDQATDYMMSIARESLEGTPVGFISGLSTEYTITFNETEGTYYLNDLETQQSTLIQEGESYTFTTTKGNHPNRFIISATPFDKSGIATGVTDLDAEAPKVQKVIYNDKLYIIRGGKVFSADGQLVK